MAAQTVSKRTALVEAELALVWMQPMAKKYFLLGVDVEEGREDAEEGCPVHRCGGGGLSSGHMAAVLPVYLILHRTSGH